MATSPPGFGPVFYPLFERSSGATAGTGDRAASVVNSWLYVTPRAATGTVSGSITSSGTVVCREGEPGAVTGSITSSGTITGTKYDPDAPAVVPGSGGRVIRFEPGTPKRAEDPPAPRIIRKTGAAQGVSTSFGLTAGTRISHGVTSGTHTLQARTRGGKTAPGAAHGMTTFRNEQVRGDAVSMHPHADIRRMRDDADLLLLV